MKKIVFAIEQLCGGGAERVTAALVNALCADHEVHLVTYQCDLQKEYPTDSRIIRHNLGDVAGSGVLGILNRIRFMRREITAIQPDCVVSLALPRMVVLLTAALLGKRIPVVLSERNDPVRFPSQKYLRALRLWAYTLCDGLVFQTHQAKSYFPGFISGKSTVITNPITGKLPARYEGVRENKIVNYCRLNKQKNLPLLIDAFSDIAEEFPEHSLVIYGDGPEKENLEQRIRERGMTGRILLPGYCSCIHEEILKAAMFVSSSDYEGISNSMLEAIALGIPTVCTDCPAGGARETIRNGVNGILVPTNDRNALAEAMRKVLTDCELAESLSRNGCTLRRELTAEVIAASWLEYICKVIS